MIVKLLGWIAVVVLILFALFVVWWGVEIVAVGFK